MKIFTVREFRKKIKTAFDAAYEGEEVLITKRGAIFALINVERALKHKPFIERLKDEKSRNR